MLSGLAAQAKKSVGIEAGNYSLKQGQARFCEDFTILQSDILSPQLIISGRYEMIFKNTQTHMHSDLDEKCEFRQSTSSEVIGKSTQLVRINSEYCQNKLQTLTTFKVIFQAPKIILNYSTENSEGDKAGFSCEWMRD